MTSWFAANKDRRWRVTVVPSLILTLAAVWSYLFNRAVVPFPDYVFYAILGAFIILAWRIYRDFRFQFYVAGHEFVAFFAFLLLNLTVHWQGLFFSVGGDEQYHTERALFALTALRRWLQPTFATTTIESLRASMWHVFDLRHLAVIDLWRAFSFALLAGAASIGLVLRAVVKGRSKKLTLLLSLVAYGVAVYVGDQVALPAENHPPLRLLPIFSSALLFGLNSFALRLPGVVIVSLMSWWSFVLLRRGHPDQPRWWQMLVAAATAFIPSVYYVAEAVEPSVYGFAVYLGVLLLGLLYLRSRAIDYLILAALCAGIGMLLRQSTIAAWILIAILFVASPRRFNLRDAARVFYPLLLGLPYFYSVSRLGHTAVNEQGGALHYLMQSVVEGVGIMSILNSTTIPWIFVTLAALCVALRRTPRRELALLLLAIPVYAVFHTIWIYLWGLGRYQAEYVAPFIVLLLFFQAERPTHRWRRPAGAFLLLAALSTIELNSNLSLDTNYQQWPRMRVTSTANFPYRETLATLKRAESQGDFVLVGGSPWYGPVALWISGFSLWESDRWRRHQDSFDQFLRERRTAGEVRNFMRERGIRSLVVQTGTRRERQHRENYPGTRALIAELERVPLESKSYFYRLYSFSGEHGGILSIYNWRE